MKIETIILGTFIVGLGFFVGVQLAKMARKDRKPRPKTSHYTPFGLMHELELKMMQEEL